MSSDNVLIPHDWVFPKKYFRQFYFENSGLKLRITANGKTNTLKFEQGGKDSGNDSATFDWITVSIERIRMECDMPYRNAVNKAVNRRL